MPDSPVSPLSPFSRAMSRNSTPCAAVTADAPGLGVYVAVMTSVLSEYPDMNCGLTCTLSVPVVSLYPPMLTAPAASAAPSAARHVTVMPGVASITPCIAVSCMTHESAAPSPR